MIKIFFTKKQFENAVIAHQLQKRQIEQQKEYDTPQLATRTITKYKLEGYEIGLNPDYHPITPQILEEAKKYLQRYVKAVIGEKPHITQHEEDGRIIIRAHGPSSWHGTGYNTLVYKTVKDFDEIYIREHGKNLSESFIEFLKRP